jgi:hypothetical protein
MSSTASLIALLIAANVLMWAAVSYAVARRRRAARVKPHEWLRPGTQAGSFAPLAPVAPVAPPVAEPPGEEPAPLVFLRPVAGAAETYEIVWYREGERLVFALQPLDGRSALIHPHRSGTFAWAEDRDPPPSLRDAQREHGRLRARLLREGWTRAGRGERWFSHRFRPPQSGRAEGKG